MDHKQWQIKMLAAQARVRKYNAAGARAQVKGDEATAKENYAAANEANKEVARLRAIEPRR